VEIEYILKKYKNVAVVGFSDNQGRISNEVTNYLNLKGYKVFGVNPNLAGLKIRNIQCFASILDIDFKINIVNIFRRSEFIPDLVKEVCEMKFKPDVIWVQTGIFSDEGKKIAEENGIFYLENKCILLEHKILKINNY